MSCFVPSTVHSPKIFNLKWYKTEKQKPLTFETQKRANVWHLAMINNWNDRSIIQIIADYWNTVLCSKKSFNFGFLKMVPPSEHSWSLLKMWRISQSTWSFCSFGPRLCNVSCTGLELNKHALGQDWLFKHKVNNMSWRLFSFLPVVKENYIHLRSDLSCNC